jgi:hypothetical protein
MTPRFLGERDLYDAYNSDLRQSAVSGRRGILAAPMLSVV